MKSLISILFIGVLLTQTACISTQAFSKASYISNEAIYLPKEKINAVSVIAVCDVSDNVIYEHIISSMQSSLSAININNEKFLLNTGSDRTNASNALPYSLKFNPIKDEYIKDELNNPVISKQITVVLQKNTGEKIAAIAVSIDRTKSDNKSGNEIAALVFKYLKKKNFI